MEAVETLVTALGLLILFILSEAGGRFGLRPEVTRRFAHTAGAGTAAAFPLYLHLRDVVLLAVVFTAILMGTWLRRVLPSIHHVRRTTYGALVFPAGLALAALAAWPHPAAVAFAALVLALADPAAAMVGERSTGPGWAVAGGGKTAQGSLAFLAVALVLACLFSFTAGEQRPAAVILVAATLTVVEGTLGYGLDNLPLPVVAALLGEWLLGL